MEGNIYLNNDDGTWNIDGLNLEEGSQYALYLGNIEDYPLYFTIPESPPPPTPTPSFPSVIPPPSKRRNTRNKDLNQKIILSTLSILCSIIIIYILLKLLSRKK